MRRRNGSILVALLWCMAFLSLIVVGVLHTASMELRVVKNYGDSVQASYLALAGVEKAKALIYQDILNRRRSGQNHTGQLDDAPQEFKDVSLGRGTFRVFHPGDASKNGQIVYGVRDEESRLNLNQASNEELGRLPQMTPDIVAAIIDWRDEDSVATPGGAEADYYLGLQPPYLPRNGPFQTTRELLMVRGVTRELFAGEDANLNGLLDPEEDDGALTEPPDNRDGILDAGWSDLLTVNSMAHSVNASGENRVDIQTADENALTGVPGLSAEVAKAIVAHRRNNRFESLADLLDVGAAPQDGTVPANSTQGGPRPSGPINSPDTQNNSGPRVIDESLLATIADGLAVGGGQDQPGAVNINTAGPLVLVCLPGITPELAQAIINYRQSSGFFSSIAALLKVPGMNRQIFKQLASRICVRSETFRILAEGRIPSTGARKRLEVIVRLGTSDFEMLSWREDL